MDNRLSDVHTIAGELLRRGEIGGDLAEQEGPKVVRVERHIPGRGVALPPAAVPFGLDEEMRKMNAHLESIRRSVEFTEAHVAIKKTTSKGLETHPEGAPAARNGWAPLLITANITLLGLLLAEIYDGFVGKIGASAYQAIFALISRL